MRFLYIFLVALAVVFLIRAWLPKPAKSRQAKPAISESMVPCSQCKVHIPKSEAIELNDKYFCSAAHQSRWLKEHKHEQ